MTKFVPLEKQNKKAQKAWNNSQRGSWNGVKPYSRTFKDAKHRTKADRSKEKVALRCYL